MEEREFCAHRLVYCIRCLLTVQEAVQFIVQNNNKQQQLCSKEKAPMLSLGYFFLFSQHSRAGVLEPSREEGLLSGYEVSLLLQVYSAGFH